MHLRSSGVTRDMSADGSKTRQSIGASEEEPLNSVKPVSKVAPGGSWCKTSMIDTEVAEGCGFNTNSCEDDGSGEDSEDDALFASVSPMFLKCTANSWEEEGISCCAMLDTGASLSFISTRLCHRLPQAVLTPVPVECSAELDNGSKSGFNFVCVLPLEIDNHPHHLVFNQVLAVMDLQEEWMYYWARLSISNTTHNMTGRVG